MTGIAPPGALGAGRLPYLHRQLKEQPQRRWRYRSVMTRDNGDPVGATLVHAIRAGDPGSSQQLLTTHPGRASAPIGAAGLG